MAFDEKGQYWSQTFKDLDFSNQEIELKEFDGCAFEGCDFSEAILKRCRFIDCEFIKCNLSNLHIEYSKFSDVAFYESKLIGIDWTKASWPRVALHATVKFHQSLMNDCSFFGLQLQEIVLEECKAHSVDFREGDFSHANFRHSDLSGSLFNNTVLSDADFSEATAYDINIHTNNIKRAKFSRFEAVRLLDCLEIELVD